MIDHNKWINTIPTSNKKLDNQKYDLDHDRWLETIPKQKSNNATKKISIILVAFVFGLIFVSAIKNETRNLEKEINDLHALINSIKTDLHQATLDHEFITSPENVSDLAKKYLETDLRHYKISQINLLNKDQSSKNFKEIKKAKLESKQNKTLSSKINMEIAKKVEAKRDGIKKIKKLYSEPDTIPDEIKNQITKKVKEKKVALLNIYKSPSDVITLENVQRWGVIQVVKVFLGIPIVPGR